MSFIVLIAPSTEVAEYGLSVCSPALCRVFESSGAAMLAYLKWTTVWELKAVT
jgi:hypothetical protein